MEIETVEAVIEQISQNEKLLDEKYLAERLAALADLAYFQELAAFNRNNARWTAVTNQIDPLAARLKAIDRHLFERVRSGIRDGRYTPTTFRQEINPFTNYHPGESPPLHIGPDGLDSLINGIFNIKKDSANLTAAEEGMIHLEPTPARAILDMVDHIHWKTDDIFYDIGSGFGQVIMLVNLLTGMEVRGVEIEAGFCEAAQKQIDELHLRPVKIIRADAREVAYEKGTIFFLFTPFTGRMLQDVMAKLEDVARDHLITICSYGSITFELSKLPWLTAVDLQRLHDFKLAIFYSQSI